MRRWRVVETLVYPPWTDDAETTSKVIGHTWSRQRAILWGTMLGPDGLLWYPYERTKGHAEGFRFIYTEAVIDDAKQGLMIV